MILKYTKYIIFVYMYTYIIYVAYIIYMHKYIYIYN